MKHDRPYVCVVGSTNMDLFFRMPRLPQPGETLAGYSFHTGFGGKGANQAVMAARLGAHVTVIGRVGRDAFGEESLRNFRERGIDIGHVQIDDALATGVAGIVVDDTGQNCILLVPGANAAVTPQHICDAAPAIRAADILLCQLEVPVEASFAACRIAREAGTRIILNLAPALPTPPELRALADVIIVNETEFESLTGQRVAGTTVPSAGVKELARQGTVIVTLGALGSVIVSPEHSEHVPARRVEALDTTGAGDAFVGSLAVFLVEGLLLRDAVHRANAVAALTVTTLGTQTSYPTSSEVEQFLVDGPGF